MKIIHVLSGLTKGGGERVAVELANKAAENGDEVVIIAGWPEDPNYLQNKIHSKILLKFVSQKRNLPYLKIIPWLIKNRKWICEYDILHCHLTYGAVFSTVAKILFRKILRNRSPLFVETYHAVGMPIPNFNQWFHSRMLLFRDAIVLMATDPYWDIFITKHQAIKTEIISNGISIVRPNLSLDFKQDFKEKLEISKKCKFIVGTVGMLRPDRSPWLYIPIFKKIYEQLGNDVEFIIAGGGSEMDKMKSLIEQAKLSKVVHLAGIVNDPLITISNMDVYISMSVGGTAGISMIEAALCKVPVIGIQLIEGYIQNDEDWVWSHTNHLEIAEKIISLLKNTEEKNKLAQQQNEYVNAHFTSQAMFQSYYTFYKNIIASTKLEKEC